ncbi:MAG: hypothetical protein A2784_01415 [Candidatus Chisholmbacteria bacterium RIFCSPHIGHO2_01_FULL_48_12]|uniref:Uncharacterized protein n=1 Tax=Candidatus Chisholmbacteria bacterium RIFCSPHIGHO2_01_FULL_48_12 TaxID=1797589 RepID=A0A1G1VQE0_9BACT|nr:MAG: hypothetical protein A2784_01415 [Candidatus Chisholmbacteria bacterium RIFCSPHIGHO2_01_FULL_48_12]
MSSLPAGGPPMPAQMQNAQQRAEEWLAQHEDVPKLLSRKHLSLGKITALLFLLVTLPLTVFVVAKQKQLAEVRSKAAEATPAPTIQIPTPSPRPITYTTQPNMIYMGNLDSQSFSVWWRTNAPDKGCVTVTNVKDNKPIKQCDEKLTRTHLIDITGLKSYITHKVEVETDGQKIELSPFWGEGIITGLFDKQKTASNLAFGKIVSASGESIVGATVFAFPNLADRSYLPVMAKTDESGGYKIDLSLLESQQPENLTAYLISVVDENGNDLGQRIFNVGATTPFPDLVLREP